MHYKDFQLSGIYSLLLEKKPGAAQLGTLYKMEIPALRQHMANLKRSNPEEFGWLAVSALAEPQTHDRMLAALGG
jgi:hypothetical protein